MAKRIVEETLANGDVQYRVESNRILGFIPCKWHTCSVTEIVGSNDILLDAVFATLEEAEDYCGIEHVTKRTIIN